MSKLAKPNEQRDNDYYAVCDECARRFWASTMRTRWDGAFVDDDCWEPYHEGYKSKVIKEDRSVPTARNRNINAEDNQLAQLPPTAGSSNDGFMYVVQDL